MSISKINVTLLRRCLPIELRWKDNGRHAADIVAVKGSLRQLYITLQRGDYLYSSITRLARETSQPAKRRNIHAVLYEHHIGKWIPLSKLLPPAVKANHTVISKGNLPYKGRLPTRTCRLEDMSRHACLGERPAWGKTLSSCQGFIPHTYKKMIPGAPECQALGCNGVPFYTCAGNATHVYCVDHYRKMLLQNSDIMLPMQCPTNVYTDESCQSGLHVNVDLRKLLT